MTLSGKLFRHALLLSVLSAQASLQGGCSDEAEEPCTLAREGEYEVNGPSCCSGGCGSSVEQARPRICQAGQYKCEGSAPVLLQYCAYQRDACKVATACTQTVGIGNSEDKLDKGKVPELCCDLGCSGKKAYYRVCKTGLLFECPSGAVPISRCKDPTTACNGLLQKYRDNGNQIPAEYL